MENKIIHRRQTLVNPEQLAELLGHEAGHIADYSMHITAKLRMGEYDAIQQIVGGAFKTDPQNVKVENFRNHSGGDRIGDFSGILPEAVAQSVGMYIMNPKEYARKYPAAARFLVSCLFPEESRNGSLFDVNSDNLESQIKKISAIARVRIFIRDVIARLFPASTTAEKLQATPVPVSAPSGEIKLDGSLTRTELTEVLDPIPAVARAVQNIVANTWASENLEEFAGSGVVLAASTPEGYAKMHEKAQAMARMGVLVTLVALPGANVALEAGAATQTLYAGSRGIADDGTARYVGMEIISSVEKVEHGKDIQILLAPSEQVLNVLVEETRDGGILKEAFGGHERFGLLGEGSLGMGAVKGAANDALTARVWNDGIDAATELIEMVKGAREVRSAMQSRLADQARNRKQPVVMGREIALSPLSVGMRVHEQQPPARPPHHEGE